MKKSELKRLVTEALEEQSHLMSAEEVAGLVQNNPVDIEDGLKVYDYDNAEQFLRFFSKHNPEKMYKPGRMENRYIAVDKPQPVSRPATKTSMKPMSQADKDASIQRFYDTLKYKGD